MTRPIEKDDAMIRLLPLLFATLTAVPSLAADGERVQKDIAYSEAGGNRTRLDVYAPGKAKTIPS